MSSVAEPYAYAVFSLLGAALLLPILPSHIRARNASTLLIAGWSMAWSICTAVNAILYADLNLPVPAVSVPVTGIQWCDFSQAVLFCANIGSLGAQLTLLRRLKIIAAVKTVTPTARSAFSRYGLEVLLGVALPIVLLALHVVVQGHRIDIIEGYGCTMPQYVNSLPYIFLYSLWPPILALVSLFYGAMAVRSFWQRRLQFAMVLESHSTGMSKDRYIRLLLLPCGMLLYMLPLTMSSFIQSFVLYPMLPWISWDYVHDDFNYAYLYSREVAGSSIAWTQALKWCIASNSFIFVALFGFTEEQMAMYRRLIQKMRGHHKVGSERVLLPRALPSDQSFSMQTQSPAHDKSFFFEDENEKTMPFHYIHSSKTLANDAEGSTNGVMIYEHNVTL